MGTVEKIVDNLVKMGAEKKNLASKRYNEISVWLKEEVSLIRALIESSPRNSSYSTAREGPADARETISVHNNNNNCSSNNPRLKENYPTNESSDQFQRQKRKSPETRQIGSSSGESPEQKRNSLDYEEMAVAAGKNFLYFNLILNHPPFFSLSFLQSLILKQIK